VVPRGGLPSANILNGLDCQTALCGSFDPQRLFGALANPFLTYFEPRPPKTYRCQNKRSLAYVLDPSPSDDNLHSYSRDGLDICSC